jgi:hypothetical protein
VAIDPRERQRWERQVAALASIDEPAGGQVTGEARRRYIAQLNETRVAAGRPPVVNDEDEFPELGLHRRACSLGLVR